jgi:hypothetical protein
MESENLPQFSWLQMGFGLPTELIGHMQPQVIVNSGTLKFIT